MDKGIEGERLTEVLTLLRDIASECGEGNGSLGDHIPAVRKFGERADNILIDLFDSCNFGGSFPPDEGLGLVIGLSPDTQAAIDAMHEASARLGRLLVQDFDYA